jgi:hypothetical protein
LVESLQVTKKPKQRKFDCNNTKKQKMSALDNDDAYVGGAAGDVVGASVDVAGGIIGSVMGAAGAATSTAVGAATGVLPAVTSRGGSIRYYGETVPGSVIAMGDEIVATVAAPVTRAIPGEGMVAYIRPDFVPGGVLSATGDAVMGTAAGAGRVVQEAVDIGRRAVGGTVRSVRVLLPGMDHPYAGAMREGAMDLGMFPVATPEVRSMGHDLKYEDYPGYEGPFWFVPDMTKPAN